MKPGRDRAQAQAAPSGPRRAPRLLLLLAAVPVLAGGLLMRRRVAGILWALLGWAHGAGAVGWATAALVQMLVACTGVLPASLTGLAAGAVYGVTIGFLLAAAGTLAGALIAFLLGRSLLRPVVIRWLERRRPGRRDWVRRLDRAIARDGWRTVCLLRLSPVMPFAATSYLLGLTGVPLRDYLLGTLASLPALLGYVILGHLAGAGLIAATAGAGAARWTLLGIGAAATLVLTLRLGRMARAAGLNAAGLDDAG